MSLLEALSAFLHDAMMVVDEYQIQLQVMFRETSSAFPDVVYPTLPGAALAEAPPMPCYSAEDLAGHPPEWRDDLIVMHAVGSVNPYGLSFLRKIAKLFPTIPQLDMLAHIGRLVAAGRISIPPSKPARPETTAEPPSASPE
jgi:hypothetical protein